MYVNIVVYVNQAALGKSGKEKDNVTSLSVFLEKDNVTNLSESTKSLVQISTCATKSCANPS